MDGLHTEFFEPCLVKTETSGLVTLYGILYITVREKPSRKTIFASIHSMVNFPNNFSVKALGEIMTEGKT